MAELVTLTQAQAHLRLPVTTDEDTSDLDLLLKLTQAQAVILDYLNRDPAWREITAAWTVDDVPFNVHAAILLELGELWRFRGDDREDESPAREDGTDLSPTIVGLLRRLGALVVK